MGSAIDIGIIIGYFILMLIIGYFSGKGNANQEDYFLAGRSMPWIPVALSIAATMISANGFIGGPGWAYNSGMYSSPFSGIICVKRNNSSYLQNGSNFGISIYGKAFGKILQNSDNYAIFYQFNYSN